MSGFFYGLTINEYSLIGIYINDVLRNNTPRNCEVIVDFRPLGNNAYNLEGFGTALIKKRK